MLMDYLTATQIRPATEAELAQSIEASQFDGGAGVFSVGERLCYAV